MKKLVRLLLFLCMTAILLVSSVYAEEEHVHNYGEWNVSSAATCSKDGLKVRMCSDCGYVDKETIPATGKHNYGEWNVSTKATCDEDGLKVRICSECGDVDKETIQSPGHQYGEWQTKTKATCDEDGLQVRICSECGKVDKETIQSPGHQYGEWQTKAAASCTEDGEEVRICSECGKVDKKIIPAKKHSYTSKTVAPTTKSRGYTEHTCTVCGYSYRNQWKAKLTEEETDGGADQTRADSTDETVDPDSASSTASAEQDGGIVTDAENLAVAYQATREVSIMKVVASAEADGSYDVRKLHLSTDLLTQWKNEGVKAVLFVVGETAVQFDLEAFDSEDIALIANDVAQTMKGYVIELNPKADSTDAAALLRVWLATEDGSDTDITEFVDGMELTVSGSPVEVR